MAQEKEITLTINGRDRAVTVPAGESLLQTLRDLGYVEVKSGCEKGDCGACAVLIDGVALDSCLTLTWTAAGRAITTVVGLGTADDPHPLQKAFQDRGAVQCGYCTPGLIIAAKSMLDRTPDPDDEQIRQALGGNLCRCTGYTKVFDAVRAAARMMRRQAPEKEEAKP